MEVEDADKRDSDKNKLEVITNERESKSEHGCKDGTCGCWSKTIEHQGYKGESIPKSIITKWKWFLYLYF